MVQRKPTPEEQLLKLIEGSGDAAGKKAPESKKPQGKGRSPLSFSFLGRIPAAFEYWKQSFQKKKSAGGGTATLDAALDIKWINRALIVMVVLTLVYLVVDLALFKPGRKGVFNQVSVTEPLFSSLAESENAGHDAAFYLQGLKKRNLFLPAGTASQMPEEKAETAGKVTSEEMNAALSQIKLVGISWGDEPLAMVEDSATGRTYFLKKGQEFKGLKVQKIDKEKVHVTYEGQEAELI